MFRFIKIMKDQLHRNIQLDKTPKRIVSLVPSQTELLCDLGLQAYVVGVTKFCVHPNYIKTKAKVVGGTKQIDIEKIKDLRPDIILCNKEENTEDIVIACEAIAPVHVSDIFNLEDSLELIAQYGIMFNKKKTAQNLIHNIHSEYVFFKKWVEHEMVYNTIYFIWKSPWMVAANNTFVNYMLQLNKFKNYYRDQVRYPEIELKENKEVELVLLSSEPYPFKEAHKKELQAFYPKAKLLLVDGEMFSWYGSRLKKAFTYFKSLHEHL
ncbi:ABC-type Fe3+-hydroxamate transport system substrate-binding protein [Jejuia pallidilutea]|uniref:ABC-type Fe3+-hydroxamate transport system substrate-binding protein n=2 Tax=Jejuia pallidilutea TaxID=504487 RepID=A0A362WZ81_9FLAO|nr:ABC-type Fe3+-hydroxamate transport system substrate-binding protein [Jejuia pallidilutea]